MRNLHLLRIGAWLNILLAIGHILCMPWLDAAFRLYGIDALMDSIASHGSYWPYMITIVIALCFALCASYAFSAEGSIRRLPLLWLAIFTIASVFLLRAGIGCYRMFDIGQYPMISISSVAVSGGIGLLYLIGGIQKIKSKKN